MENVDAGTAAKRAAEIAAKQIERLGKKDTLEGFDVMDLANLAKVCLSYDNHYLTWMSKLEPGKLQDELIGRVKKELAPDGRPQQPARRAAAG